MLCDYVMEMRMMKMMSMQRFKRDEDIDELDLKVLVTVTKLCPVSMYCKDGFEDFPLKV